MIPKIIHLVWIGPTTPEVERAVGRHAELNPEHEIKLYRDADELNPLYRAAWEKYTPVVTFKSDLLRWSLVEKYGGWYFDVDCVPYVPVSRIESHYDLTGRQMFITFNRMFLDASIMAAGLGWDGWDAVREYLVNYRPTRKDGLQNYACFSWDLIRSVAFDRKEKRKWTWGSRERFNFVPESRVEPFVLRGSAAEAYEEAKRASRQAEGGSAGDSAASVQPGGDGAGTTPPGLRQRMGSYGRAVRHWVAAGQPVRGEEEIGRIYEAICRPCGHFDDGRGTCRVCGCRVRRNGAALTNKIKMATEHCPTQKW